MRSLILIPDNFVEVGMGGMSVQCRELVRHMWELNKGIHFDIVCADSCDGSGDNWRSFGLRRLVNSFGSYPGEACALLSSGEFLLAAGGLEKPDIIHCFDWSTVLGGRLLKLKWGIPLVMTVQLSYNLLADDLGFRGELVNINRGIEWDGLFDADRIIQVSRAMARRFPQILDSKTSVVPNGINLGDWEGDFERYSLPGHEGNKKCLYIGRIDGMKNIGGLLDAHIPEGMDLIICGGRRGGSDELLDLVKGRAGRDGRFHYIGGVWGLDKIRLMRSVDCCVMPSLHEPFGIVALEALAAGRVLLSSCRGGMGDFLTSANSINCGITGDSIGEALDKFMSLTPLEIESYRRAGQETCVRYSWYNSAVGLWNIYSGLGCSS